VPIVHSLTDAEVPDAARRRSLFSGDVFVYSPRPTTVAFCAATRNVIEQMLGDEPGWAQQRMSETEFAVLFKAAARNFSHVVTDLASGVVADFDCDPATTFIGAPSLTATTGRGFIAHGLGVPQHPHRDTWYAASPCQLNWWLPLYDLDASAAFAFHPAYWDLPIQNSSSDFDYEEWSDADRLGQAATAAELFAQPRPLAPIELDPELRVSCPAGGAILSSVAQLYSTVPNETLKTYFSVHFQTVSEEDLENGEGASNVDADPRGTSLAGFVRCSDLSPIPPAVVQRDLERRQFETARRRSI
jgi:hypothetical protein